MFEIEVFSDPVVALVGEGGLLLNDRLGLATEYDEQLIKPALFLGDRVTLRSHRVDLVGNEIRDHNLAGFAVPLVARLIAISSRRDAHEMEVLRLKAESLLADDEIGRFEAILLPPTATEISESERDLLWSEALDRAEPLRQALMALHRERGEALTSSVFAEFAAAGFMDELPWDSTPKTRGRQIADSDAGENAEFERAFFAMVDEVETSPLSVMLDDVVSTRIARFATKPVAISSTDIVRGAVDLMRMVEGLSLVPIDEVGSLRDEVKPYIAPFRAFMIDVAARADLSSSDSIERARSLRLAWEREVEPAVEELRGLISSSSFRRNAIDLFATSKDALQTVGMAIGGGLATGFVGLSSLAFVGAAAPPFISAFVGSVRSKEATRRNRAYLMHAMSTSRVVRRARAKE
jgi:hypothetical protein